ncbi:hypothetical protein [Roseivirga pacifica]|uniref:hypothetical protein n=1 Tax=Roseivirga pacifica TaxID=1267423 RepID=UPI00227A7BD0|nr:hypothetical protein [Roseivirga pacifica]
MNENLMNSVLLQEEELVAVKSAELFEPDFKVYADRGSNCFKPDNEPEEEVVAIKTAELFEPDFKVYADRGSNCFKPDNEPEEYFSK